MATARACPPVGAIEPGRVVITDPLSRVPGAVRADASLRPIGVGVAWRTTVIILFFAGLVGVLVVLASGVAAAREERLRLQQHLSELMAAVEPTAALAASASDQALAGQVALGLLRNAVVARVVIRADGRELVAKGEVSSGTGLPEPALLTHSLSSPTDPARQVGELQVWPAAAVIERAAVSYSRYIALILGVQLVVVMISIAWVVLNVVTRPVKKLSDDLHRLRVDSGQQVMLPAGHRGDEIGRLASDINGLIIRMGDSLRAERDMRHQREEAERRLELVFENVNAGVFTLDGDGMLQDWNPWLSRTLGLPVRGDATRSYALRELLGDHSSRLDALMVRALADNRPAGADFEIERGADATMWLHLQLNPLPGKLQGIVNDVSEQKRAEMAAVAVAERDPLTGLLNLRSIEHRLAEALAALPDAGGLALMVVDLDGFGEVN
ncbi:MAG: PAS domain S-box protein, partial [Methyloversatilis sp.]|nr:PAS domain S-box protein [Methyloversatilis sp.]